jgi:hypothetical protein
MADNKTVQFKIKVDGKELDLLKTSVNDFDKMYSAAATKLKSLPLGSAEWKQLNSELKNADTAFQQTKDTVNEAEGKFKSLRLQIRQATVAFQEAEEKGDLKGMSVAKKRLEELNDQFEITQLKAMEFHDALATMPGVAGLVGQSIQGIDKAFKVLVANPILATVTAVVGAFMFLKDALGKTKEGTAALNKVQQAFSQILGPILALINTVAIPIFEALAKVITKVAGAFTWFAEKLGVSKKSIADATRDVDEVGKEAAENEKKRQEEAAARAEKEAQKKKEAADKAKKNAEDNIKQNEDLQQSIMELTRAKLADIQDPIKAMKVEQKQKDEDYQREKKRIEDLRKVKGVTAAEDKAYQTELNNLEATYLKDKKERSKKIVDTTKEQLDKEKKAKEEFFKKVTEIEIAAYSDELQRNILTREQKYKDDLDALVKDLDTQKVFGERRKEILTALEKAKTNDINKLKEDDAKKNAELIYKQIEFERQSRLMALQTKLQQIDISNKAELEKIRERSKINQEQAKIDFDNEIINLDKLLKAKEVSNEDYLKRKKELEDRYNVTVAANTLKTETDIVEQRKKNNQAVMQLADSIGALGQAMGAETAAGKTLIRVQQALALATTGVAIAQAFMGLGKDLAKGFPTNIIAVASTLALIATAISQFKALTTPLGGGAGAGAENTGPKSNGFGDNRYAEGGLIGGKRHAAGGTMIEAEQGEAIMTRGAVTMFAPLLSQLNQMGGGTSFSRGAAGSAFYDAPKSSYPSDFTQTPVQVIKTYVVEGELTSQQQKQARLKDLSTI